MYGTEKLVVLTIQSIATEAATGHAEDWTAVDVPSRNPKFSTGPFRGKSFLAVHGFLRTSL